MWESLTRDPYFLSFTGPLLIITGLMFLTILASYAIQSWRKHQAAKMEHELKLEMLSRGMSADEIERVLAARSIANRGLCDTQPYAKK